jgi:hypothetical protein
MHNEQLDLLQRELGYRERLERMREYLLTRECGNRTRRNSETIQPRLCLPPVRHVHMSLPPPPKQRPPSALVREQQDKRWIQHSPPPTNRESKIIWEELDDWNKVNIGST